MGNITENDDSRFNIFEASLEHHIQKSIPLYYLKVVQRRIEIHISIKSTHLFN